MGAQRVGGASARGEDRRVHGASGVNSVNLIGELLHDPELRSGGDRGEDTCSMRVAVERRGRDGLPEPGVVYVDVLTFGADARECAERLAEGLRVAVTGRLEREEWVTPAGLRRSRQEVIADRVEILDPHPAREPGD